MTKENGKRLNLWDLPFEERVELVVNKWLENLRSGRFRQGRLALRTPRGLCCLGVLCETILEIQPDFMKVDRKKNFYYHYYDGKNTYLPWIVQELLGIDEYGSIEDKDEYPLSYYNDNLKKSFEDLADIIEQKKDKIFLKHRALRT